MSDLRVPAQALARRSVQFPVGSYFDPALFEREMARSVRRRPALRGARARGARARRLPRPAAGRRRPRPGAHRRTAWSSISNVCRHRQAVMLQGRGNTAAATSSARCTAGPTTCKGELIGAPHFAEDPCLNLHNYPLQDWNGLLFETPPGQPAATSPPTWPASARAPTSTSPATCSTASSCTSATTTGRPSSRSTSRTTTSARSTPGWAASSPARTCAGSSGRTTRCRRSGVNNELGQARQPVYQQVARRGARLPPGRSRPGPSTARSGSPTTRTSMVEWYPHVLMVSTLHPMGPHKTLNMVEFFYPEEIAAFEREFVEAQQAAYMGDLRRGRRDRPAHGRRPPGPDASAATTRSARTRARWKTACSTSTSGTAGEMG